MLASFRWGVSLQQPLSVIDARTITQLQPIQAVISHMTANSFALKVLPASLTAGVLAIAGTFYRWNWDNLKKNSIRLGV